MELNMTVNAGFTAWNISKRISSARNHARVAHELVDAIEDRDSLQYANIQGLLRQIEDAGVRAMITWERIEAAVNDLEPGLIEPTESGISVIQAGGSNPAVLDAIHAIWGEDDGVAESDELFEQLRKFVESG